MKRIIPVLLFFIMVLSVSVPAWAGETGRFGLGINVGYINNFKMWDAASTESGNVIQITYSYDFNDYYTAALELGYVLDANTLKEASDWIYIQTGSYLNIDHIFHTGKLGPFSPYFKFGTGIYAVNGWWRKDHKFYQEATNVMVDLSAGMGSDFKLWNALVNVDLCFPGIAHEIYFGKKVAYILSLGYKHRF